MRAADNVDMQNIVVALWESPVPVVAIALLMAAGTWLTLVGSKIRRKLRGWHKIQGKVTHIHHWAAQITWKVQGQEYSTSPMHLFALRKGEHINLLVQPEQTSNPHLNIWTHNGFMFLYSGAFCWTLALGLGWVLLLT